MTTSNYMPSVVVEIAFNAGYSTPAASRTWTDVSDYVELAEGIKIDRGRSDEFSTTDANGLTLTLDNRDGRFTAGKTGGAYYPNVKIGRPIRVTSTPQGNRITNSTFEVDAAGWESNTLLGAYTAATWARSTVRWNSGAASLLATWPLTAVGSFVDIPVTGLTVGNTYTASAYVYVPAGHPDPRMEVAFTANSARTSTKAAWTRLSVSFVATTTTHYVGVQVASATAGQQCWIDDVMVSQGPDLLTFDSTIATPSVRFLGYVDEWPVAWDGTDAYATAQISARSRMARIGFDAELRSTVQEEWLAYTQQAYYPLNEPSGATAAAPLAPITAPLLSIVPGGTALEFGGATGLSDGSACIQFNSGEYLKGVAFNPAATITVIEAFISTSVSTTGEFVRLTGSNELYFTLELSGGKMASSYDDTALASTLIATGTTSINDGAVRHLLVKLTYGGAATTLDLYLNGVLDGTATVATVATQGLASAIRVGQGFTGGMSNVMLSNDFAGMANRVAAGTGYANETASQRITRYAGYADIPSGEVAGDAGTNLVAAIDTAGKTAIDAMRVVEATESGVLFDARDNTLTFHGRAHRYNTSSVFTLDVAAQEVETGIAPKLDRSTLVNDVTGTASDGTTTHVINQTSIDAYGFARQTIELAASLDVAYQAAAWRVGLYAEPQPRIPELGVDLLPLSAARQATLLAADVGTRITLSNLPVQAPASSIDFFIEGYTETIGPESYGFEFNVSPTAPGDVFILNDAVKGVLDNTTYRLAL
jgi:hypothetical protein